MKLWVYGNSDASVDGNDDDSNSSSSRNDNSINK